MLSPKTPRLRSRLAAALPIACAAVALLAAPMARAGTAADDATFEAYAAMIGGLLGLRLDPARRAELRAQVDDYFRRGDEESIANVRNAARGWQLAAEQPPELREAALRMSRPDVLVGLHAAARRGRMDSQWLLDRYYAANPPLAPGRDDGLPLTRDLVDARLDLQHFVLAEIRRQPVPAPDASVRAAAARSAAATHATLTGAQQIALARQPGELLRTRYGWGRASDADRLLARADMGAALTPAEQADLQRIVAGFQAQLNGKVAQHANAMLGGAVANVRDNSDLIMGRGTAWNPATNRWEQDGGIVTEYDGRVLKR